MARAYQSLAFTRHRVPRVQLCLTDALFRAGTGLYTQFPKIQSESGGASRPEKERLGSPPLKYLSLISLPELGLG